MSKKPSLFRVDGRSIKAGSFSLTVVSRSIHRAIGYAPPDARIESVTKLEDVDVIDDENEAVTPTGIPTAPASGTQIDDTYTVDGRMFRRLVQEFNAARTYAGCNMVCSVEQATKWAEVVRDAERVIDGMPSANAAIAEGQAKPVPTEADAKCRAALTDACDAIEMQLWSLLRKEDRRRLAEWRALARGETGLTYPLPTGESASFEGARSVYDRPPIGDIGHAAAVAIADAAYPGARVPVHAPPGEVTGNMEGEHDRESCAEQRRILRETIAHQRKTIDDTQRMLGASNIVTRDGDLWWTDGVRSIQLTKGDWRPAENPDLSRVGERVNAEIITERRNALALKLLGLIDEATHSNNGPAARQWIDAYCALMAAAGAR